MDKLYLLIDRLITLSIEHGLITERDRIYTRNRMLALFNESTYEEPNNFLSTDLYETLDELADLAVSQEMIEDTITSRDIFTSTIMNIFLPQPSIIENQFWANYEESPKKATTHFYQMSQNSNYIKMNRIAKNVLFKADSKYGEIDITINLSKPEKDPKEIARLKSAPPNKYPSCLLCVENEGYRGTLSLPDRANHRMISLHLNSKDWMLQYSPYLYYNEHCILLSQTHEPMHLTQNSFYNLLSFVKMFPHYFIGSNADLPIVGGSILSHEHYQGGCYTFPIHRANIIEEFKISQYPNVTCRILNWPLSTIQLLGDSLDDVAECTNYIYEKWKNYSDPDVNILSHTGDIPHNTITPIAQMVDGKFAMNVVLRNNRTTSEYPSGIFHPHEDVQHIKKENIGLIEVMGLAILPGRLLNELEAIKSYIKGEEAEVAPYHLDWATQLKEIYDNTCVDHFIQKAVGEKFVRVLEDAGVFKLDEIGIEHFKQFINHII